MSHRVFPRSLLSLLLLWQLLASVLAHPLPVASHAMTGEVAIIATNNIEAAEHCAEHQNVMHSEQLANAQLHDEAQSQLMTHPCKSLCKCPCAGTPALAAALPVLGLSRPDALLLVPSTPGYGAAVPAKLLRPPIG
ncbi:MAG: hypothetical protein AB7T07_10180 [Steroidobacteraceae bacterium]